MSFSLCLHVCVCVCVSLSLSLSLSLPPPFSLSLCLSDKSLNLCLCLCLSVRPSVCLPLSPSSSPSHLPLPLSLFPSFPVCVHTWFGTNQILLFDRPLAFFLFIQSTISIQDIFIVHVMFLALWGKRQRVRLTPLGKPAVSR